MTPAEGKPRRKPIRKAMAAPEVLTRTKKKFNANKLFDVSFGTREVNGKKVAVEREVWGYEEPTEWTPKIDPSYVFPEEETKVILMGLALRDRLLLIGDTGTGKTSLLEQIAARLNYSVVKINFDGAITRQDLVGEFVVKGRETIFQYGVLVHAFKMPGCLIILDEWDTISGECAFVLQRPLQKDDGKILVTEMEGELVELHSENVIAATANTAGQGDDTGLYAHGTQVQNYSQLNRFGLTIRMKYLEASKEQKILEQKFDKLTPQECQLLVKAINMVRDAYQRGELSAPLSPRDLINWAEKFVAMGCPHRAAKYCFLNRMPEEDCATVEQLLKRVLGEPK